MKSAHELKILSLNTWCNCIPCEEGKHDKFIDHLVALALNSDILCLQEVHMYRVKPAVRLHQVKEPKGRPGPIDLEFGDRLVAKLKKTHQWFFASHFENAYHDCEASSEKISYGNLVFIKKQKVKLICYNEHLIYGNNKLNDEPAKPEDGIGGTAASRKSQIFTIKFGSETITIEHVHGLSSRKGKTDTISRNAQTAAIRHGIVQQRRRLHLDMADPAVLIIGDLNYTANMEAMSGLLSGHGPFGIAPGVNLNSGVEGDPNRPKITDTRTKWYPPEKEVREADFALASQRLEKMVYQYTVHPEISSNHALLELILKMK